MQNFQRDFIQLAIKYKALQFGEFTLKSGRVSPYFFNMGCFTDGAALHQLGQIYAACLHNANIDFSVLFGPAYKGIPLAVTTAVALNQDYQQNKHYCFNRKEVKAHGEGGQLVGAPLQGKVMIIDDVITAGTAIQESIQIIQASGANLVGAIVALDRQERSNNQLSAIQHIQQIHAIPVLSIITLEDLIHYLAKQPGMQNTLNSMQQYRKDYGVTGLL
jgi:orotate phosphoribosyltransferase